MRGFAVTTGAVATGIIIAVLALQLPGAIQRAREPGCIERGIAQLRAEIERIIKEGL